MELPQMPGWARAYGAVSRLGDDALSWMYYLSSFVGLNQAGFLAGLVLNVTIVTFGFCFCCFGNMFNTFRISRHFAVSSRQKMPFVDLVSNRGRSGFLNSFILLLPFAISSTLVISNTLLVPSTRIFPGSLQPPTTMMQLCSPPNRTLSVALAHAGHQQLCAG